MSRSLVLLGLAALVLGGPLTGDRATPATSPALSDALEREARAVESRMVAWRRDIHQHPELGNREVRTAALVADHLRGLGYQVREKVAHTGVVAVLAGGRPGPVVALRADMDALPVTEEVPLPFASKVRTTWAGREVGVMHACGHDAHVAILMAAAEVFAKVRGDLPGTVKLLFQPAEEGPPPGEQGGARLMIREGALENPRPEVIFGLHVTSAAHAGRVSYRAGAAMAGADGFRIAIKGRQTHAASPWRGVDPIVVGAQVVLALQTIASRQVDVTREPAVLTVGIFNAGNRGNIIPDSAELVGTLRTFDPETRQFIMRRVKETAEGIARSAGAEADVHWRPTSYLPVINDPALARRMAPTFQRVVPADQLSEARRITAAEDFSLYAREIPGLYFFLGAVAPGTPIEEAAPNHSPRFTLDESALLTGLRALTHLTVDYMTGGGGS